MLLIKVGQFHLKTKLYCYKESMEFLFTESEFRIPDLGLRKLNKVFYPIKSHFPHL